MDTDTRTALKDRARGLMDAYGGFAFGAVMQASILLKIRASAEDMNAIADELSAEQS